MIPPGDVARILERLRALRLADENIYLRTSSINLFNGMVSLTFSCDGSHYLRYDEFLGKNAGFWFGTAALREPAPLATPSIRPAGGRQLAGDGRAGTAHRRRFDDRPPYRRRNAVRCRAG